MTRVFIAGIFDLLHAGHVMLLQFAKKQGTYLIVAVNADESACQLKGPGRPIMCLNDRITVLRELRCVDAVIPFDELTPELLIRKLKPDVLVKGPDCIKDRIAGMEYIESYGGRIVIAPKWIQDAATYDIIERIKNTSSPDDGKASDW